MEEPLEQEHSMTNDDLKPSSSSTTTKSSRSTKQTTTTNGTTRRHKRRRQTNSTRSSSDHSTSSSRSSSSSSHSSHSSLKNLPSNDQESKTSRSCLAQEQLQIIVDKTKTGKYDILDGFAFLSFETDDDWRIAFEHFRQQQLQQSYANKKSYSLSGKKNGNLSDHIDGHSLHRSISVPCKIEDGHRMHHIPSSAPVDDTSIENHRSSMWQDLSPNKNSVDRQSMTTIKSEPTDRTNRSSRTTSEHDENHFDIEHNQNSIISSRKSNDDIRIESNDRKHHHHYHHHHHHKSHKRHKTKHDLSVNGDSSNKHPTITSMSDLARQHIKHEPIPLPPSFNFPTHFDPKLFSLPAYPPFAPPPPPSSFPGSYDHQLMLARGLYGSQYPRDISMPPPPPRPPSRSLQHPFSLKENHPDSMEKMLEKYYPGVLPSYFAAAAAAAGASTNSNSPVSSLNVKMHGASPNGPDHPLWSHRDALQRQYLAASNKQSSTKSPLFDSSTKLPSNHAGPSPTDHHHRHHHHHRRHSSSTSNTDIPNPTTPTGHPLYLAPVIVTEFHQHQHNHNHTHEHKLNITTKDDRQASPRSKTPLSNENKKPKSGFSVTDMFIDKTSPITKHSPQQQGFLSVINNKKETNSSPLISLKKPFNGKWSTAHVHIAWMIYHNQQRQQQQREELNHLNPTNKIRSSTTFIPPSSQSTLLPPPLPLLDNNNDLSLLRPPMPPPPFSFPFDTNSQQNNLFRPTSTMKLPRPTVTSTSSSSSSTIKTPTIKREQKTPFIDDRVRRTSPSPLSRPTSGSNFLPSSPSHRMRMDYSSLLLPPPPQHQQSPFSLNDDRKRFLTSNTDLFSPFGSPLGPSPFLSSFFPMNAPQMPPPPPPPHPTSSLSSRRSGIHSDSPKSSLFPLPPPPSSTPFDFNRSPLLTPGLSLQNNHFESDRYRFMLEQQARDRGLQLAMMAAAAGNAPPPPMFSDPNSSALFKPF